MIPHTWRKHYNALHAWPHRLCSDVHEIIKENARFSFPPSVLSVCHPLFLIGLYQGSFSTQMGFNFSSMGHHPARFHLHISIIKAKCNQKVLKEGSNNSVGSCHWVLCSDVGSCDPHRFVLHNPCNVPPDWLTSLLPGTLWSLFLRVQSTEFCLAKVRNNDEAAITNPPWRGSCQMLSKIGKGFSS